MTEIVSGDSGKGVMESNKRKVEVILDDNATAEAKEKADRYPDFVGHIELPKTPIPYDLEFSLQGQNYKVPAGSVLTGYAAIELGSHYKDVVQEGRYPWQKMRSRKWWKKNLEQVVV